jgi:hypothetical protein
MAGGLTLLICLSRIAICLMSAGSTGMDASKLHVQALGLVVAYSMHKEGVEEGFAAFEFASKDKAVKKCMLDF